MRSRGAAGERVERPRYEMGKDKAIRGIPIFVLLGDGVRTLVYGG